MSDHWYDRAACQGMNTDLWFVPAHSKADLAKIICDGCPVRSECLQEALKVPGTRGVWGGLTEGERSRLDIEQAKAEPVKRGGWTLKPTGMSAINAAKTHCKYGHEFTEENTAICAGKRRCRTCGRRRVQETRDRQRKAMSS